MMSFFLAFSAPTQVYGTFMGHFRSVVGLLFPRKSDFSILRGLFSAIWGCRDFPALAWSCSRV